MTKETPTDAEHQRRYAEAIQEAREASAGAFQSWFNVSGSVDESIARGYWDFAVHILRPAVCRRIERPHEKTALEIGYGGGRILNAACSFFRDAIGIDIHAEQEAVQRFLESQGRHNFRLIRTSGREIPVETASVDFVYSFIVLQHLPTFEVFECYLRETFRCLKPGGVAQLYFGRYWSKISPRDRWRHWLRGYKEITDAPVNYTSLVVRLGKAKSLARAIGFQVLDWGHSYKSAPDGFDHLKGGQHYVTLLKP